MKAVLLVDSSSSFLKLMELYISRIGYRIRTVPTAAACLQALSEEKADLVICELNLPDLMGVDLCRAIKENPATSDVNVVIVTTENSEEKRRVALSAGCSDYLTKPVSIRPLFHTLERLVGCRRQHIRTHMEVSVSVQIGKETISYESFNFGEGGVYLKTDQPQPIGTTLKMSLQLPGLTAPLFVEGEVIYVIGQKVEGFPAGMGLKFIHLSPERQYILARFIEDFVTQPGGNAPVPQSFIDHPRLPAFPAAAVPSPLSDPEKDLPGNA